MDAIYEKLRGQLQVLKQCEHGPADLEPCAAFNSLRTRECLEPVGDKWALNERGVERLQFLERVV